MQDSNYLKHISLFDNSIQYDCDLYSVNVHHNEKATITYSVKLNHSMECHAGETDVPELMKEVQETAEWLYRIWSDIFNDFENHRWPFKLGPYADKGTASRFSDKIDASEKAAKPVKPFDIRDCSPPSDGGEYHTVLKGSPLSPLNCNLHDFTEYGDISVRSLFEELKSGVKDIEKHKKQATEEGFAPINFSDSDTTRVLSEALNAAPEPSVEAKAAEPDVAKYEKPSEYAIECRNRMQGFADLRESWDDLHNYEKDLFNELYGEENALHVFEALKSAPQPIVERKIHVSADKKDIPIPDEVMDRGLRIDNFIKGYCDGVIGKFFDVDLFKNDLDIRNSAAILVEMGSDRVGMDGFFIQANIFAKLVEKKIKALTEEKNAYAEEKDLARRREAMAAEELWDDIYKEAYSRGIKISIGRRDDFFEHQISCLPLNVKRLLGHLCLKHLDRWEYVILCSRHLFTDNWHTTEESAMAVYEELKKVLEIEELREQAEEHEKCGKGKVND